MESWVISICELKAWPASQMRTPTRYTWLWGSNSTWCRSDMVRTSPCRLLRGQPVIS